MSSTSPQHVAVSVVGSGALPGNAELLRPHAQVHVAAKLDLLVVEAQHLAQPVDAQPAVFSVDDLGHRPVEEIGVADKGGDETAARRLVDFGGRADLLDPPFVHDRDPVAQAHGLALVVGDVEKGGADLVVDDVQLDQHALAQLQVKRRQGFVEQQDLRLVDQGPGDGHALFLAAADLVRLLVRLVLHLDQGQHAVHLAIDFRRRPPRNPQPEGNVVPHRQMREQGVVLEDRC